ncbi:hypothetical protein ACE7GA_18800 [Roseomonas sp. CCTCC AB2023176]|uniref:hypothetical protein n=1 Tax=Roseomonas sp. CCTCC AB2023176 TaxID=3342640 RepID=UPI0035E0CA91
MRLDAADLLFLIGPFAIGGIACIGLLRPTFGVMLTALSGVVIFAAAVWLVAFVPALFFLGALFFPMGLLIFALPFWFMIRAAKNGRELMERPKP